MLLLVVVVIDINHADWLFDWDKVCDYKGCGLLFFRWKFFQKEKKFLVSFSLEFLRVLSEIVIFFPSHKTEEICKRISMSKNVFFCVRSTNQMTKPIHLPLFYRPYPSWFLKMSMLMMMLNNRHHHHHFLIKHDVDDYLHTWICCCCFTWIQMMMISVATKDRDHLMMTTKWKKNGCINNNLDL